MWTETRNFFDLPLSEKVKVKNTDDYPYGYLGVGGENLSSGYDGKRQLPDLKECFAIGPYDPRAKMPPVQWPPDQHAIQKAWLDYYKAMERLSGHMLRLFAIALQLPENWFDDKVDGHRSALRLLNYPPQSERPLPGQIRAGEHTDYGTLTILRSDENVGGLQVKTAKGEWYDVKSIPDSFVINLGDLMQRWTNDRWKSTLHRVVNPNNEAISQARRQSVAFFHNLNGEAICETFPSCITPSNPNKYASVNAWEHLMKKHTASTKS